jgi:hypothetical protein
LAHTLAVGFAEQRFQSEIKGTAFQVWGTTADVAAAENPLLFLQNDDTTGKILVVTYIRMVAINLATTGAFGAGTYFTVGFDQSRTSGGTAVTPVNMNRSSGKIASVTAYSSGDLAGAGTAVVLSPAANAAVSDRHYPEGNLKELVYRKEGSIILAQGKSITLSLVTDFTAGYAYGRIAFVMADRMRAEA